MSLLRKDDKVGRDKRERKSSRDEEGLSGALSTNLKLPGLSLESLRVFVRLFQT